MYIGVFYSMLQSGPSIMHDAFVASGLFFDALANLYLLQAQHRSNQEQTLCIWAEACRLKATVIDNRIIKVLP